MFYANGTLTKYEVIDMDVASSNMVTLSTATSSSVSRTTSAFAKPSAKAAVPRLAGEDVAAPVAAQTKVVSSYFLKQGALVPAATHKLNDEKPAPATPQKSSRSPKDVSEISSTTSSTSTSTTTTSTDVQTSATKKRMASMVLVDDDFSDDSDAREDQVVIVRSKPRAKKTRVIVESDAEDDSDNDDSAAGNTGSGEDAADAIEIDSDVSSPREDDVFMHELKLKQEKTGVNSTAAANWMAAFGRGNSKTEDKTQKKDRSNSNSSTEDGWHSVLDLKNKNGKTKKPTKPVKEPKEKAVHKRSDKFQSRSDGEDDSEDDDHHTRSHDEVGQLLHECERIAEKLRRSIRNWSAPAGSSASPVGSDVEQEDEDAEEVAHVSIAAINSLEKGGAVSSDRRVVTQEDIPDICETLVLKPYQVVGINWLLLLCENSVSGVLADEMGLGKTVQTISFLLLLEDLSKKQQAQQQTSSARVCGGPHLVVVPASVLNNWKREFAWIAPSLRIVVYHGAKEDRLDLQDSLSADDFDVLLTTYSYFERDSCQDDRNFLRSFRFGYMILDEGHSIKNSKTSRFKRITAMRARNRLVLSGTPIQNNLNELLALLSFLMPRMFDHGSDELLSFFDGNEQKKCAKVRKILAPFILRREKKYVLSQLVAKTVHVEMLKAGPAQHKAYTDLIESVIKQKEAEVARKLEEKERKKKHNSKFDRQVQLLLGLTDAKNGSSAKASEASDVAIFTQLRKAANHPVLLRNHYVSDDVLTIMSRCLHRAEAFGTQCSMAMVRKELESYCDFELHDLCVQYGANEELRKLQLPMETLLASSKFDYLRGLLPKLQVEGHRVLIFSQWTKLLDLLEVLMGHMKYRYLRLDGSTDVAERQGMIDTYNEDTGIFVFLLSTRAGGLGINLTAADTVILHDLDFNPTNDEQACDRCHRIGQTKPVSIYKLVAQDTVDHDIYRMGETKTQLNHAVLGKLNAHSGSGEHDSTGNTKMKGGRKKASDGVTVEMMLASVISNYKKQ